jgi:predicted site-specific integrase-resolvase
MNKTEHKHTIQSNSEELLTRKEVADWFDITGHTVRKWELDGLLPSVRTNRRVIRYRLSDCLKLIENSTVNIER